MNTESFLEGVLLDGVEAGTTPPFSLRLSKAPVLTEGYLTLSPKTTNQEIVKYSGVSGSTVTVTDRGYDSTGTGKNVSNQKKHSKNTSAFKGALNHLIIDGKASSEEIQLVRDDLASTANAKGASLVGVEDTAGYFSSTDVEGALAELGAGAPGVADASETVAGKVELPTDAEVTAGTATGATGARLTPTNAQLNKSISLKGSITTTTDSDEFVVNQSGVDKRITQANLRTQLAGDETKLGTAQKATDAEAIAGVEDTKYITPAQYSKIVNGGDIIWESNREYPFVDGYYTNLTGTPTNINWQNINWGNGTTGAISVITEYTPLGAFPKINSGNANEVTDFELEFTATFSDNGSTNTYFGLAGSTGNMTTPNATKITFISNGDNDVQFNVADGAATTQGTNQTVTSGAHKYKITYDDSLGEVKSYIDDVLIDTITTNIPSNFNLTPLFYSINQTSLTIVKPRAKYKLV